MLKLILAAAFVSIALLTRAQAQPSTSFEGLEGKALADAMKAADDELSIPKRDLAVRLGGALAEIKACGRYEVWDEGLDKLLNANGLDRTALTEPGAFADRIQEQAHIWASITEVSRDAGVDQERASEEACSDLIKMYGLKGKILQGVLAAAEEPAPEPVMPTSSGRNFWNDFLDAVAPASDVFAPEQQVIREPMSAIDVAVDYQDLVGKRVLIEGCTITKAEIEDAWCTMQTDYGSAGVINIETRAMERDMLRFILRYCSGFEPRSECRFDLWANIARDYNGDLLLAKVAYGRQ